MFGNPVDFQLSLDDGQWMEGKGEEVIAWKVGVRSEGAYSMNLLFSRFKLPEGSEMYVRSPATGEVVGPFTFQNNKDDGKFAIFPMQGNELIVEYYAPAMLDEMPEIEITKVVHGFKDIFAMNGRSGRCNINVACTEGSQWTKQTRSTVMMLSKLGSGFCSGTIYQ